MYPNAKIIIHNNRLAPVWFDRLPCLNFEPQEKPFRMISGDTLTIRVPRMDEYYFELNKWTADKGEERLFLNKT